MLALARERARIQELEAAIARVRNDAQVQQKTIGALQARLRETDNERFGSGIVYALAAAMLLFALLAAALWALRPRQRRQARWFDAQAHAQRRAAAHPSRPPATDSRPPAVSQHPSQWNESAHAILPVTGPATIGGLEVTTVLAPQSHYVRMAEAGASANTLYAAGVGRSASPSMEALLDLEQQAEFFVVLGQEDAAIALLRAHLRDGGGASPLPFLQLLEIHQRRRDHAAYEELRRDYEQQFATVAPEWSSDLHFGRSLDTYPQTVARLQALWPTPLHAMQAVDDLLFRRGEDDPSFDFPAYRELLFLYGLARELAGQVETDSGTIDLLLPLEHAPAALSPGVGSALTVDLDVSGWPEDTPAQGLVIRRSAGRRVAH
jgi:pilus assembly protein FimV